MTQSFKVKRWMFGAASAALAFSAPAQAQEAIQTRAQPTTSEEIVVPGEITYRNRTEGAAPVLEYGLDYFQRFEPLTVGDALKRVPSVAFLSDVLESDGVRLRGLDPAYTQIMINGEQVPGAGDSSGAFGNGADGAFFVDRIPAELIERVEIVRSNSANRSGDAVAGAINIVMRDGYSLDGGYVRGGAQYWTNDENWGETLGAVWGGEFLGGRLLVGANMQDRHNPKDKFSARYEPNDTDDAFELQNTEVQTDIRDGTDYSGNFSYEVEGAQSEFALDGFYVRTDRTQTEDSIEYDEGVVEPDSIQTLNANDVDIEQDSWSLNGRFGLQMLGGETRVKLGYASFTDDTFEFEDEATYDEGDGTELPFPEVDVYESEIAQTSIEDTELKLKLEHERTLTENLTLEFGVHYENKEREFVQLLADTEIESDLAVDFPSTLPFDGSLVDRADLEVDTGDNTITRDRLDPYVMLSGNAGIVDWEAGLRYETTTLEVEDRAAGVRTESSNEELLPSASVAINLTDNDRLLISAARTVRNPSFSFLSPALLEGELGDNDFVGDPNLKPETAWGLDVGYERRLGRTGIVGVNVFYRDISNLIELFSTGAPSDAYCGDFEDDTGFTCDDVADGVPGADADYDPDSFVYSARNTGDGTVWGVEFDLSTSLTAVGLENTGVFLNYSLLDSEVDDEFGSRRFNSQAESILNVGFIQDLPSLNSSFGLTYRDQGEAFSRVVGEEVTTNYGADLEFFVEHRFTESFVMRLTGSNLLDESKDERFDKFDNAGDQASHQIGDYDELEFESETAGPVFQLVGRYAF
ncbi:MAG: TonB-dependent receptor [Hyphomonadaceae bacterium]|nr:TonB-dependent receptor [Hyphomonadaceae bacterium]